MIVRGTFWFMIVAGLNVNFSDVYKLHGFKKRCPLLREDVCDLLIISAPPSLIPWTTERVGYIRQFFPSLPIPGSTSFLTIDTIFSQQSLETGVSLQNFWSSSLKTISESETALGLFIETLKQFFTSQTLKIKKKNTLVYKLHLFLPNLFCLQREDIQMETRCLLTLSNPQDILVKIRRPLQCPFIKSTIFPSRRELQAITYKLNEDFRSILTPRRTPTGFRVNLVTFVRFVACNLYNKTSLVGLRVDIYGVAMSRRKMTSYEWPSNFCRAASKLSNPQPMSSRLLCLRWVVQVLIWKFGTWFLLWATSKCSLRT